MKLLNLKVKNFRSFGERDAEDRIRFGDGINLIVGENNVGKSNLLRVLEVFKSKNYPFEDNDWHCGVKENEILMELDVDIGHTEFASFSKIFGGGMRKHAQRVTQALQDYGRVIHVVYSSGKGFSAKQERIKGTEQQSFGYDTNMNEAVIRLLHEKIKVFSEVRKRPSGENKKALESYDGALVADVLATLKMGNPRQRKKFGLIKQKFTELFPTLRLEVTQEKPNTIPRIMVEKTPINYEVPIDFVGAGIGEMIILLTHLIASEEMVFGLDLPELHFHPHSQRLLLGILKEQSENNQILIVTHSPLLVEPSEIDDIMIVREERGETIVTQLPEYYFSKEEELKLQRHLDIYNREVFFSRGTLIVEGETEVGAMPIFSKALEKDFDKYGISLVRTGKHFGVFIKLVEGLNIPYLVMCDRDVLMNIEKSIEWNGRKIKTSPVFYNLSKKNMLPPVYSEYAKTILEFESKISSVDNKEVYRDELFN